MRKKNQVIHNDNIGELERLREEYAFIGRKSTIDADKLTLTVHNTARKKKKARKLSSFEKLDRKYS